MKKRRQSHSPAPRSAEKLRKRDDKSDRKTNSRWGRKKSQSSEKNGANGEVDQTLLNSAGNFANYPEITQKTQENLKKKGIEGLFPI